MPRGALALLFEQGRLGAELLARLTRAVIDGAPEAELDAILDEAQRVLPQ
ncbi:hypothetical protein [Leifsonia xyli]